MGKLAHTESELTNADWNFRENKDVRELLDHIANILAREYVERMKNSQK